MSCLLPFMLLALNANPITDLNAVGGVHSAKVQVDTDAAKQTIIHIKDWHLVSKADFLADQKQNGAEGLPKDYDAFVKSVRKVQSEQEAVIRMLAKKHGLKTVYKEGLTLEDFETDQIVLGMIWTKSDLPIDNKRFEALRLGYGTAGKLNAAGIIKLKPCESKKLFEACNPVKDGKLREIPEEAIEARETFIVNHILKSKYKVSVVILGGAHDLSDNVPKGVRLVEVTVKEYANVAK